MRKDWSEKIDEFLSDVKKMAKFSDKDGNSEDRYCYRLHALTTSSGFTSFYLAFLGDINFKYLNEMTFTVNMKDYVLKAVATEERFLNDNYKGNIGSLGFNFFPVSNDLLNEMLTTRTGITINKKFKIKGFPKTWLTAFEMLTDKEKFEQCKKEDLEYREKHSTLHFMRSHISFCRPII